MQYDNCHQHDDRDDSNPRGHAEYGEGRRHADELGDQCQPIDNHQIEQGKPAPECPETVEDRLGVSALGDGTEAHGHLLDVVGDGDEDQQEPDQVVAVLGAGGRVGRDAARVVVRDHDNDAGTGEDQVKSSRFPGLPQPIVEFRKIVHIRALSLHPVRRGSIRRSAPRVRRIQGYGARRRVSKRRGLVSHRSVRAAHGVIAGQ